MNDLNELGEHMTELISKLHIDIIIDILSRLPVQSLSQCRWVSKSWYNLINLPCFAHTQRIRAVQCHNPPCIIFENRDRYSSYFMVDETIFDVHKTVMVFPDIKKTLPGYEEDYTILSSVNGLICLTPEPYFVWKTTKVMTHPHYCDFKPTLPYYIWNPVIGDYFPLPHHNLTKELVSGFGFDSATNQYKVVRISKPSWGNKFEAEVCTIGAEVDCCWRPINNVPCFEEDEIHQKENVFVSGALHWFGYTSASKTQTCIISFQIGSEEFGEIKLPSYMHDDSNFGILSHLTAISEECLCLADSHGTEMWIMEDYGIQGSWKLKYEVTENIIFNDECFTHDPCDFIKIMNNGEALILCDREFLGYYNPEDNIIRLILSPQQDKDEPISFQCFGEWPDVSPFVHVQSLISPSNMARLNKRNDNLQANGRHVAVRQHIGGGKPLQVRESFPIDDSERKHSQGRGRSNKRLENNQGMGGSQRMGRKHYIGGSQGTGSGFRGECYSCGKIGHTARNCRNGSQGGGRRRDGTNAVCYGCNGRGHFWRDCPNRVVSSGNCICYRCGKLGHLARNCNNKNSRGRGCYNCGNLGHYARECLAN